MRLDLFWNQRAATADVGSMAAVREPFFVGSKVGYAAALKERGGGGSIVPTSAVALGVADLAMNVSLHCARTGEAAPGGSPFSSGSQLNGGSTVERLAAGGGGGGCGGPGGSDASPCRSSELAGGGGGVRQPVAAGSCGGSRSARCSMEPREVAEACRARRVSPHDLVLSAAVSYESELESATLALTRAVASLSAGYRSIERRPVACLAGHELSLVVAEDVWLPDVSPRADDDSSAASEPDRGCAPAAGLELAVSDHPLCVSLSVYRSVTAACGAVRTAAAAVDAGPTQQSPPAARLAARGRRSPTAAGSPSAQLPEAAVCGKPSSDLCQGLGAATPATSADSATTGNGVGSCPQGRPAASLLRRRQEHADRPPPPPAFSSSVHSSLRRGCVPPSSLDTGASATAADCHRHTLDYSLLQAAAAAEREQQTTGARSLTASTARLVAMKQRRSFSGFGGGLVNLLERMGRSLSSTDRLRRVSLDSGGGGGIGSSSGSSGSGGSCLSHRAAMAAVVDNEACARRLSAAGCCALGHVHNGGSSNAAGATAATAGCSKSSPDLSLRWRAARPSAASGCSAAPSNAACNGGSVAVELTEVEPADVAVAATANETNDGSSCSDVAPSAIWQMASDRCDTLLSLLEDKPASAEPAAAAVPSGCPASQLSSPQPYHRPQSPPLPSAMQLSSAFLAPVNSHLRGLSRATSSPCHLAAAAAAADVQETPTAARRRRPPPSAAAAAARKPLSSTPARASLIMNELVQTEADYVAALRLVVDHYVPVCEFAGPLEPLHGQVAAIFGNVEELHDFHSKRFFAELCRWQHDPFSVGQSFLEHKSNFEAYAFYIKNKPRSDSIMSLHGAQFFKARQQQLADLLDLGSYLLKPIQRLGKYALILQQLVKECSAWAEAAACSPDGVRLRDQLQQAEDMVRFCLRHGDDLLALDTLYDCGVDLASQGQLLRQEQMTLTRDKKKTLRQVFLFEKVIIFSKIKRVDKGHDLYKYKESISMHDVGLTETVGLSGVRFELWYQQQQQQQSRNGVGGNGLSWLIDAPSPQSKQAWVKDIGHLLWAQARVSRQKVLAGLPHPQATVALSRRLQQQQQQSQHGSDVRVGRTGHLPASAPRVADTSTAATDGS